MPTRIPRLSALLPLLALLAPPISALAQPSCTERYQAEQERIAREFTAQPPKKGDKEAELAWSKKLHAALAESAKNADQCERDARRAVSPSAQAAENECIAANNRRTDELTKKYRDRTLDRAGQATRRQEEQQLLDERMACVTRPRR